MRILIVLMVGSVFAFTGCPAWAQTAEELSAQRKAAALEQVARYKSGTEIPAVTTKEEFLTRAQEYRLAPREDRELKEKLFNTLPVEMLTVVLETWGLDYVKDDTELNVIADRAESKFAAMNKTRQERDLWQLAYFRKEYGRKSGFTAQQWAAEIIRFAEATSKIELNKETGIPENKFSGKVIPQIASMYVLFSAKATTEEKIILNDQLFKTLPYDEATTQKFLQFLAKQKKEIVPEP